VWGGTTREERTDLTNPIIEIIWDQS